MANDAVPPDPGVSEEALSDGSHQASTCSRADDAPGLRDALAPGSPHAPSATQQSVAAVTVGHGVTMPDDSAQLGSAPEQGQHGQQVPGLRASFALESLREVAAGQRHGRLITPRTSAEGALGDQAQPHDAGAAAQTADGLHAKSSATASEGIVSQGTSGEQPDSVENPQGQHVVRAAAGSGGAEDEAATGETPASPVQPARAVDSAPSGNPFASPVPAAKQTSRGTPESGALPEVDASPMRHSVEALQTAVASMALSEMAEARAAPAVESPAGGCTPVAKRGRFAPRSPLQPLVSAEELAEAAIRAATAALERVGAAAQRPPARNAGVPACWRLNAASVPSRTA